MSLETNKAVVKRYFVEVLDGGRRDVMAELFHAGAPQHFPSRDLTFDPASAGSRAYQTMRTTLHHLLADGDYVVAHLTHVVSYSSPAAFVTQLGSVDTSGRRVHWDAVAIFRMQAGKIAEEWVNRDELSILSQLDALALRS